MFILSLYTYMYIYTRYETIYIQQKGRKRRKGRTICVWTIRLKLEFSFEWDGKKKRKNVKQLTRRGGGKVGNSGTIAVEKGTERFRGRRGEKNDFKRKKCGKRAASWAQRHSTASFHGLFSFSPFPSRSLGRKPFASHDNDGDGDGDEAAGKENTLPVSSAIFQPSVWLAFEPPLLFSLPSLHRYFATSDTDLPPFRAYRLSTVPFFFLPILVLDTVA